MKRLMAILGATALLVSCDANETGQGTPDGGSTPTATDCPNPPRYTEDVSTCQALATDYRPRFEASANDAWPACITDDGAYHKINDSISTIARTAAFEQIATLLFANGKVPSAQDFIDARVIYAQDQGIDSRVQRREDVHFPAGANGAKCSDPGVPELNPERCVGPAKLLPILNDAFARGAQGEAPRVQAARIEAALLWFFYVSPLAEATSCASKPQDCDSCWAYYAGGTPRESPLGLGRYLMELAPETHHRAYDGTLAVRCWRNLDNETGTAANLALRDQARDQLDRAMIRGVALVLRQRIAELSCADTDGRAARLAFIQTLAPFLDRELRARDAARADAFKAQVGTGDQIDAAAAIAMLDAAFPCP